MPPRPRPPSVLLTHLACFSLLGAIFAAPAVAQTTWTLRNQNNSAPQRDYLWGLVEGAAGIVAVGENGRILHSNDGRAWTRRDSGTTVWLTAIAFGAGRYAAVGDSGTILTSIDAITWVPASAGTTARLNNVKFFNGVFVAVGEALNILSSPDGVTWTRRDSQLNLGSIPRSRWLRGIAFGGGIWIAVGQSQTLIESYDNGTTWMTRGAPGAAIADIEAAVSVRAFRNSGIISGTFLVAGENGSLLTLSTGIPFPASLRQGDAGTSAPATNARIRSASIGNGVLIVTGENGEIYSAPDSFGPWRKVAIPTTRNLVGAAFAGGSLFLVGENETIYQSEPLFPSKLANISTRGAVGGGPGAMIAGTVVRGARSKQFLVRAAGPALASFGLTGAVAEPVLSIYNGAGQLIASNSGWSTSPDAAAIVAAAREAGAFPFAANSRDCALLVTLAPGSYTFQVAGAGVAAGTALLEAYDLDAIDATSSRAINISTRGAVGTGQDILIAGLIVQGTSSRTLVIRGIGPSLAPFGVAGTLADPIVSVLDSAGAVLATNDNWGDGAVANGRRIEPGELEAAAGASGAFALAPGSKDAALLITLLPGAYTIQVSGANNTTGIALVEAYDVPSN